MRYEINLYHDIMHIKELNPKSNKNFAFAICHVGIKPITTKRGDVTTNKHYNIFSYIQYIARFQLHCLVLFEG